MRTSSQRVMMADVNDAIDRLHRSRNLRESYFFCECGQAACQGRITLSRAEYARRREEGRALLIAAHAGNESYELPLAGQAREH